MHLAQCPHCATVVAALAPATVAGGERRRPTTPVPQRLLRDHLSADASRREAVAVRFLLITYGTMLPVLVGVLLAERRSGAVDELDALASAAASTALDLD